MTLRKLWFPVLCAAAAACGGDYTGPGEGSAAIAALSGDEQFGAPNATVLDPLQVIVTNPVTDEPLANVSVTWHITSGSGAEVTPAQAITNENGLASATLRLGSALGDYQVEARTNGLIGSPARFSARAVQAPTITNAPASANAGETIVITGENFSPQADDNLVLFGGFRAQVTAATATQLTVVVPACVPQRTVTLLVAFGAVAGTSVDIDITGSTAAPIDLAPGQVLHITDAAQLGCVQLPGNDAHQYLTVPQNASTVVGSTATLRLNGLYAGDAVLSITGPSFSRRGRDAQWDFETRLRLREQLLLEQEQQQLQLRPKVQAAVGAACPLPPQLGASCTFQVIDKDNIFRTVNAQLKAISEHSLVYQDVNAPANGLSTADFQTLAITFDEPIYEAVTATYGDPTDIDSNSRIVILLTPVVNAMTEPGSAGFIAGFFYGCDLVSRTVCSGSNRGEVFYTITADPTGQFGDARAPSSVMNALLPVLAHEFQHMIAFGYRNNTDALWLSEGMAHHAEDVVADAFQQLGDFTNAQRFRIQNVTRAGRYLRDPSFTSLIAEGGTGTLEQRGAGWLFVKYLAGQYGNTILQGLTQSSESSVNNVVARTGRSWSSLLANWGVALYADDAPELQGQTVPVEYTFPNINLRNTITDQFGYTLRPPVQSYEDFSFQDALPASTQTYLILSANGATLPLSLSLSGQYGGAFPASAVPQLSIMRLR